MTIGVAVVGTGFGCRIHVPALRAAGFEVSALVGHDPERTARRAARAGIGVALTSLSEALARPDVDAVSIVTPPDTHAVLAIEAARAGRHVLCEKPFALDATEARAMLAAVQEAGVVGLVGHEFRFAPERALVARLLGQGAIGQPRLATLVSYVALVADPATAMPHWWFAASRGGGWLGASGSHLVDQTRAWLGEVAQVAGSVVGESGREGGADEAFSLLLQMRSGATAVLQQTAAAWGPPAGFVRVAGSAGTVWLDGTTVWLAAAGEDPAQVPLPLDLALPSLAAQPFTDDPRHRFSHLELGPSIRQAEVFAQLIRGEPLSPNCPPPATFADGVACMEVLDAARGPNPTPGRAAGPSASRRGPQPQPPPERGGPNPTPGRTG
jgi:predicted dehydrogenase